VLQHVIISGLVVLGIVLMVLFRPESWLSRWRRKHCKIDHVFHYIS